MIALTMDIVTMEHVSVEKDTQELIVQFHHAQIIVFLVDNVLTILVFVHQNGQTLIVPSRFAQIVAAKMDIVIMEHVSVTQFTLD